MKLNNHLVKEISNLSNHLSLREVEQRLTHIEQCTYWQNKGLMHDYYNEIGYKIPRREGHYNY